MSRTEFFNITSTGVTDFQPLDFSGAKQVLVRCVQNTVGDVDGLLTEASSGNSTTMIQPVFELRLDDAIVTPIVSCDNRLYWVSKVAGVSNIQVWVVRA